MLSKKDLPYFFLLALVTVILFREVLLNPTELLAAGDLLSDSVFSSNFMHQTFQEYKERALWNPYMSTGKPHISQIEYGQYYITSLLFLSHYKDYFLNLVLIAHFFLAGLFMYLFLRNLNLRRQSSIVGAIIFILGRNFLDLFAGDALPVVAYSYLPLAFLGFEKLIEKKNLKWTLIFSTLVSLQFFAGRVQYFYYGMLALSLYAAFRIIPMKKYGLSSLKYLALSIVIFFGVTAVQLLPMMELAPLTIQNQDNEAATYEFSAQESVPFKHFITLLVPDFFGNRSDNSYWGVPSRLIDMYIGILSILLIFTAIFFIKNKYKTALLALLVFSIVFALGKYTPIYRLLYNLIPGIALFKVPGRMLMVFTFSAAALASLGAEYLITSSKNNKPLLFTLRGASIISTSITLFITIFKRRILEYGERLLHSYYYLTYADTALVKNYTFDYFHLKLSLAFNYILTGFVILSILLVLSTAIIYSSYKIKNRKMLGLAIIFLLLLDLLFLTNPADWSKIKEISYPEIGRSSLMLKQWDNLSKELNSKGEYFRVIGFPQEVIVQNNLYSITASDSMPIYYSDRYSGYTNQLYHSEMLGLANVKYILITKDLPERDLKLIHNNLKYSNSRVSFNKTYRLYENKNWMPRAFIVPNSRTVSLENQFELITNWSFDPKEEVLITENLGLEGGQTFKEANITYYSPNKVVLYAENDKPGFLVISETYYPGWKAYDNGKETKIYHANYIMRALYLPAGEHNIEFIYDPMSYKIGKWITLVTVLIVLLISMGLLLSRRD